MRKLQLPLVAFAVALTLAAAPTHAAAPPGAFWTPVGPYGGVVVAIAAFPSSPEVLYAGVEHGGVFRSDDGGLHWHPVNATLQDVNVVSLAVSPSDSSVVVAGAQTGIYVSVDGGLNWAVAAGSPGTAINDIVFDPADPSIVYAVSPAGWTGRSVDGGVSWNPIAPSLNGQQPTAIAVASSAHTTVYLGTLQNGVYRSTDSGGTFTEKNTGLNNLHVSALAVDPGNALLVYAGTVNSTVFVTSDGGEIWAPSSSFGSVDSLAVDSAGTVYLGNQDGAFSMPRGGQWSAIPGAQWVNSVAIGSGSPQRLFFGFGQLPFDTGGVGSFDGVISRVFIDGLSGITVNTIAVDDMDLQPRILLGTVGLGLLQSQDGARTWTRVTGLTQTSILDVVVVASAPEAFYVAAGGIFKSTDEGTSWNSVSNGLPSNPPAPVGSLLIPPSAGSPYLAGTYRGLFRSTDGAASWTQVDDGISAQVIYALASDPASADVVYAATEQGVFKSTNAGASWSGTNSGITGGTVYDVAVVGGAAFAAGEGGLFKSSNGGASWDKLAGGLSSAPAHAIAYDPASSTVYAGTYAGVWQSTDFGANWTRVASGPANPQVLALAVLPGGGLLAGTLGGSAYLLTAPEPREPVQRTEPRGTTRTLPPRP